LQKSPTAHDSGPSAHSGNSALRSDSRWWENYAVRYALGVGVGTPIVALMCETYAHTLSPELHIRSPFAGTTTALLWAAAGLAYCYAASAPMLTLHSTRRLLPRTRFTVNVLFCTVVVILVVAGVLDTVFIGSLVIFRALGLLILVAVTAAQLFALWRVLLNPEETYDFYEQLERCRKQHSDYVESYRHMREHGNSISIVICELLLAFVLWSLKPDGSVGNIALGARVCLILAIWLAPASLVWLLGSSLERHLALSKSAQEAKPIDN